MNKQQPQKRWYIMMVATAVMWSMGGIFFKMLDWHPMVIAGIRSAVTSLVFFIAIKYVMKYNIIINRNTIICGAFMCYLATAFVLANKMTTAANAIVLQSTGPVFIMIISSLFLKQKYAKADYIAVITTMGGIMLFFADNLSGGQMLGNLVALSSGVAMAGMFLMTGNVKTDEESMNGVFIGHILTALISVPFIVTNPPTLTVQSVGIITILGVFQLGIPYVMYTVAIRKLPVLTCSFISMLEPLLNPIWVALFVGEVPGPFALIGAFIVICSILLWSVYSAKQEQQQPQPQTDNI
ncbi:MAG: DMT family transporter [Oscillospiraceae bacterium]